MEIRCAECGYLGAAGEVRPVDDGMGLVCAECGHLNVVSADDPANEPAAEPDDVGLGERGRDGVVASPPDDGASLFEGFGATDVLSWSDTTEERGDDSPVLDIGDDFTARSKERLVPEPGSGPRCRKCFHLFDSGDLEHCPSCGLNIADSRAYPPGQAPWEAPPEGKRDAQRRAQQIWDGAVESDGDASIGEFVEYAVDHDLVDFGIRTVQQHLVDHPDDQDARQALEELTQSLEVAIRVARTRAESQSDQFQNEVKDFRSRLLIGALVFWTLILLLFSWLFWGTP